MARWFWTIQPGDPIGDIGSSWTTLDFHDDKVDPSIRSASSVASGQAEEEETRVVQPDEGKSVASSNAHSRTHRVSLRYHLISMWFIYVIIITPIMFIPILTMAPDDFKKEAGCAYTIAVMAVLWCTEAMPIPITSLLPIFLLPMLGVMGAKKTSSVYINDTSMLFLGGLIVAIALEVWNLHKRMALKTLIWVGAEPRCLLLGITFITWFLSMLISNTATAAMMMTIVAALSEQFEQLYTIPIPAPEEIEAMAQNQKEGEPHKTLADYKREAERSMAELHHLNKAMCLTVAYASNIGGTGSLTGTGPNLVLAGQTESIFNKVGLQSPITYSTWLLYGGPLSVLVAGIMWSFMVVFYLRCKGGCRCLCCGDPTKRPHVDRVNNRIREEYDKLGPASYAEKTVLVCFFLLVFFWITRDLGGYGGWGDLFTPTYVRDSTPSILFGCLMFVLPSSFPGLMTKCCNPEGRYNIVQPLLRWRHVHDKMPWSLYLLLGGGFALAEAATISGLAKWIGQKLMVFKPLNKWAILLIICYIVTFATEVTSNTATATLMMPILSELSVALDTNPLFYMYPAAIATSFAFMFPVATPPNAIVFSTGALRVMDMVSMGMLMNIVCPPVLVLATATWGDLVFHFTEMPPEFRINSTN